MDGHKQDFHTESILSSFDAMTCMAIPAGIPAF
jgi:hypothetical protein